MKYITLNFSLWPWYIIFTCFYTCFLCLTITTIMHSLHFILCSIVSAPYSYTTKVISSSLAACSCSSLNWEILRHGGSCFILRHFSLVSCLPASFCFSDPVCFTSTLLFLAKEILYRSSIGQENYWCIPIIEFQPRAVESTKEGADGHRWKLRRITTFVLCSQSPLNLHHFCLTRFQIEGWLELIGTPSVDIFHQSECAWLCCLLSQ